MESSKEILYVDSGLKNFFRDNETNNPNNHNSGKNPNWPEADQLVIYRCGQGVELGFTENNSC